MADTTFTAGTVVTSDWLNDVNDFVYSTTSVASEVLVASAYAGATVTNKIDAAIADSAGRLVIIPASMGAGEPTSYPVGAPLIDMRGSNASGSGRKTLFDLVDASGSNVMTVVNDMVDPSLSHAAILGNGRATGALPNNRNIQGMQAVAYTIGNITGGGSGYVVSGIECGAGGNANGGTVGFLWGGHSYAASDVASVTTTYGEIASWRFLPASHNGAGTCTNLYTVIVDDASGTATNSGAMLVKGDTLIRGDLTVDRAGSPLNSNMLSGGATALGYLEIGRVTGDVRLGAAGAANDFFSGTAQGDTVLYNITNKALHFGINSALAATFDASGNFIPVLKTSAPALSTNNQMVFTLTSNTNLRISVRGSDGVTRTADITLS